MSPDGRHLVSEGRQRETYIPAQQSAKKEEARLPSSHEVPTRSGGARSPASQRSKASDRLMGPDGREQASGLRRSEGSRADISSLALVDRTTSKSGVEPASERPEPLHKLRRRRDFQICYREGRRVGGRFSTLFHRPNDLDHPRFGITATRKVGKAVARNKAKRQIREIYRRWPKRHQLAALDLVVHLKPTVNEAVFEELERELTRQLAIASGLVEPRRRHSRPTRKRRDSGQPSDGRAGKSR